MYHIIGKWLYVTFKDVGEGPRKAKLKLKHCTLDVGFVSQKLCFNFVKL